MSTNLKILSIVFAILLIIIILYIVKRGRISVKYSLVWLLSSGFLLFTILFPGFLNLIKYITGFEVASNMIFAFIIVMLIFINISLTIIVSGQNEKIKLLIQEVSILKEKKQVEYEKNI